MQTYQLTELPLTTVTDPLSIFYISGESYRLKNKLKKAN
ncbi:hypothetical protein A45J_0373 [hot springs metagenome]|uniref:Uncharacterized protein n=1 Tax=hot springs metagenome TaxID=433727 RepID=A0A5J4KXF5_9ZZZZ